MREPDDNSLPEQLRWAAELVRLVPTHFPEHPAVAWYVGITNGVPEPGLPTPGVFHRFRRGGHAAYLWLDGGGVWLSPWHPECQRGRTTRWVESVGAGLDLLATLPLPRPWWRFWR